MYFARRLSIPSNQSQRQVAVSIMSSPKLLLLALHVCGVPSTASKKFPILVNDDSVLLSSIIREEVTRAKPNFEYSDSDIKSAETSGNMDATQLLCQPISVFFLFTENEKVRELSVVIDPPRFEKPTKVNAFDVMKTAASPNLESFCSKFSVSDIREFQDGYATASSKEKYLRDYTNESGKNKPLIFDQVEAVVVDTLETNNIRYASAAKLKAMAGLKLSVHMFNFVHAHRKTLSHINAGRFNTPILAGIKNALASKVKPPPKMCLFSV